MLFSKGNEFPVANKGLDLFLIIAAVAGGGRELAQAGLPLPLDVKQQLLSPILVGTFTTAFLFSRAAAAAAISDRQGIFIVSRGFMPSQSLETLIWRSDSSSLAASSPAVTAA